MLPRPYKNKFKQIYIYFNLAIWFDSGIHLLYFKYSFSQKKYWNTITFKRTIKLIRVSCVKSRMKKQLFGNWKSLNVTNNKKFSLIWILNVIIDIEVSFSFIIICFNCFIDNINVTPVNNEQPIRQTVRLVAKQWHSEVWLR